MDTREEVKIGVFVCHCGTNIAGYLDIEALTEYAKTLPSVELATACLYTCSETGIAQIKEAIRQQNLTRVLVASCTPRTHEPLFREACQEAGLNPYLFEMVNIREQCSWVHMKDRVGGTAKAKDLIRMGVAKAALLEPLKPVESNVEPKALVIGGGIAGLTASLALANMGFKVILVEKDKEMGGMLRYLYKLAPGNIYASEVIAERITAAQENPNIDIYTSSNILYIEGYIGNYYVKVNAKGSQKDFSVGAIIVATGASVFIPEGLYGYDGKRVITQLQLEEILKDGHLDAENIVMIQCVGARIKERIYCSRICCMTAIKNAVLVKRKNPDAKVSILYRDIQAYGIENEVQLRKARKSGIRFIRYDHEIPPVIEHDNIRVYHQLLGEEMTLACDLVVLSTPLVAQDGAKELSQLLKVPVDENKFFLEGHVKLKPLDFATDGVFLCGSTRYPATVGESISQAWGAAARAANILSRKYIVTSGIVARIDGNSCTGCQGCLGVCPFGAINYLEDNRVCEVNPVLCKGCGACAAACPSGSVQLCGYKSEQIYAQIDRAFF
jgi:heterodisulfide reductase subunit A